MELSPLEILSAIIITAIGTAVQAGIGFGLAMVAAPLLLLVDRAFVPAPLIFAALCLVTWMAFDERGAINVQHLGPALTGRVLGTLPAALMIGAMSAATFDIIFSLLVLLAVGISLIHPHIRVTRKTVFLATLASGFMSTLSAIGGPPVALVYQNVRGPSLRANLAMFFILGCLVSLLALALVGKFGWGELVYAGILVVGVLLGVLISGPVRRYVDKRAARPILLGLCVLSACLLLVRALL